MKVISHLGADATGPSTPHALVIGGHKIISVALSLSLAAAPYIQSVYVYTFLAVPRSSLRSPLSTQEASIPAIFLDPSAGELQQRIFHNKGNFSIHTIVVIVASWPHRKPPARRCIDISLSENQRQAATVLLYMICTVTD